MKKNKSIITADKLLHLADQGIKKYDLESQGDLMVERNGQPLIPKFILQQKLCLHKGKLSIQFGNIKEAKSFFLQSINLGDMYDIRVRIEAIKQILAIGENKESQDYKRLKKLLNSYQKCRRDFVFLVNNNVKMEKYFD